MNNFFDSAGEKTSVAGAVKETLNKKASLRQPFSLSLSLSLLLLFVFVYSSSLKRSIIAVAMITTLPAETLLLIREQVTGATGE